MHNPNNILIYVSGLNSRVHFLFRHVFIKLIGLRPVITNDKDAFVEYAGAKINYTPERVEDMPYIKPAGLLYDKGVKEITIETGTYKSVPVLFVNQEEESDFYFDVFSAIFYMITRYEEYLPFETDKLKRFQPQCSIAFDKKFIDEPIVEIWAGLFKDFIKERFPNTEFTKPSEFTYLPTVDVDAAFAYRNHNPVQVLASFARELLTLQWKSLINRLLSLARLAKDPFDNFEYLKQCLQKHHTKPIFFFLSGSRGKYDKNNPIGSNAMKQVVSSIDKYAEIGLHPSFDALESTLGRQVTKSRQHYIIVNFPKTYENLGKLDIFEDYSLGYAAATGFRAGTCTPFNFFDLTLNKETELRLIPFQAMDATFKTYLKQSPQEAEKKLVELYNKIKKVNGTFAVIWHNDTFAETNEGKQWRKVFENLLTVSNEQ
jgi:hypothetical protein